MYDQLLILNDKLEVDPTLLAEQGLPFYASTWVINLLATNLAMAATFTHLLLWNRNDLKGAWSWATPTALKQSWATINFKFWQDDGMREQPDKDDKDIDPHYKEMLKVRIWPKFSMTHIQFTYILVHSTPTLPTAGT